MLLRDQRETLRRSVDGPASSRRDIAALSRWTCIAGTKRCRAASMDLHRRGEAP
jgi:hypothetical protein